MIHFNQQIATPNKRQPLVPCCGLKQVRPWQTAALRQMCGQYSCLSRHAFMGHHDICLQRAAPTQRQPAGGIAGTMAFQEMPARRPGPSNVIWPTSSSNSSSTGWAASSVAA